MPNIRSISHAHTPQDDGPPLWPDDTHTSILSLAPPTAPMTAPTPTAPTPTWLAALAAAVTPQQPAATAQDAWAGHRHSLADMLSRPPKAWLIDGWLGLGDIGMLFGAPGTGKTFVALDLALDAVTGQAAGGGAFGIGRRLSVAYATGEGGGGLADRLRAAVRARRLDGDALTGLTLWTAQPQLFDAGPSGAASWVAAAQAAGDAPDIVILDTLHGATAGADENSARDMGQVLGSVRYIRDALGCAVLLVHHANKQGGYRGSSALHGAVDLMARTDGDGDAWRLVCEKLKDGRQWEPLGFRLAEGGGSAVVEWTGPVSAGPERDSLADGVITWLGAAAQAGSHFDARQLAAGLGRDTTNNAMRVLNRTLSTMAQNGRLTRIGDGRLGSPYRYTIDVAKGQLL